jgi:hypothetical protein
MTAQRPPYNERLFRSGLRRRFHMARFAWVTRMVRRHGIPCDAVLEIGCFDGRLLDHLPCRPVRYAGFDANWEGGLDDARRRFGAAPEWRFTEARRAEDMGLGPGERFDLAVSLETLEHVPPAEVEPYLRTVAEHLDGHFLITVPNEIGPVFLFKWLVRVAKSPSRGRHGFREIVWATLGLARRIPRHEHKGFDYRHLVAQVNRHFDVISVTGHPFGILPAWLCPGIGIVARSRRDHLRSTGSGMSD